jgi:hypothetical protein
MCSTSPRGAGIHERLYQQYLRVPVARLTSSLIMRHDFVRLSRSFLNRHLHHHGAHLHADAPARRHGGHHHSKATTTAPGTRIHYMSVDNQHTCDEFQGTRDMYVWKILRGDVYVCVVLAYWCFAVSTFCIFMRRHDYKWPTSTTGGKLSHLASTPRAHRHRLWCIGPTRTSSRLTVSDYLRQASTEKRHQHHPHVVRLSWATRHWQHCCKNRCLQATSHNVRSCCSEHRRHIVAKVHISMVFINKTTSSIRHRCYIVH